MSVIRDALFFPFVKPARDPPVRPSDVAILFFTFVNICKYIITNLFLVPPRKTIMSTCTWIIMLPAIVIVVGTIQLRTASATANESTSGNENGEGQPEKYTTIDLVMAWIEKPPYLISLTNESIGDEAHGMLREVLMRYTTEMECGFSVPVRHRVFPVRVDSEFHMIELLRQNKVHVAGPIFEPTNRRYREFAFFKITDYPGSEYITGEDEANKLNLVLGEVLNSWPLFVVTLILTAIAGVIMWALVSLTLCDLISKGKRMNATSFRD